MRVLSEPGSAAADYPLRSPNARIFNPSWQRAGHKPTLWGAQKAERSHILIPIAKGRGSGERPATDDFADPAQDRLRQLRDRRFPLHGAEASVAILLHGLQHPLIGPLHQPALQLSFCPLHPLIGPQSVAASRHLLTRRFEGDFHHPHNDRGKKARSEPGRGFLDEAEIAPATPCG